MTKTSVRTWLTALKAWVRLAEPGPKHLFAMNPMCCGWRNSLPSLIAPAMLYLKLAPWNWHVLQIYAFHPCISNLLARRACSSFVDLTVTGQLREKHPPPARAVGRPPPQNTMLLPLRGVSAFAPL